MFYLKFLKKMIIPSSILFCHNSYAVNILTWWGYLNKDIISKIEKECNTRVSYDEYFTNEDFLRRIDKQQYSIAIFSDIMYKLIENKIDNTGASLESIKQNYHPNIISSFNNKKLPKNIGIIGIGITGFLYDTSKIKIEKNEDIKSIFYKANNKKIAILDDPTYSFKLIPYDKPYPSLEKGIYEFKKLLNGNTPIVTIDIANSAKDKDFALAYTCLGEAFHEINQNPSLKFITHSKASHISGDLVATLDKDPKTSCVAKAISNKDTLNTILEENYYISPFGEQNTIENSDFKSISKNIINNYSSLKWIERPSKEDYRKMSSIWQEIKIEIKNM